MAATGKALTAETKHQDASGASVTCEMRSVASVYGVDPIHDPRWPWFLESHSEASIFHTPGWLRALQRTYGYEPVVFTTSKPGRPLENGIVFCRVDSWLTGARLVSLPFSDHCQPLVEEPQDAAAIYGRLERNLGHENYRYIELRPSVSNPVGLADTAAFVPRGEYYLHTLDLQPDLDTVFSNFHKNCIQRKIRRAEREGLTYDTGRSELVLAKFYHLQLLTRRRHQLPPQPITWFRNLVDCLGDKLTIRLLSKDNLPIACILTLSYKSTLVYKYGCSDARFHSLGGMPLLFWKAIQEAKRQGVQEFDLGRSEMDNPGLAAFKEHLGATRAKLVYFRLGSCQLGRTARRRQMQIFRRVLARMPGSVVQMVGDALYRHMG
jgi:CelD/BcsL family acetyltransferase involved in cellulose biosynthesis